MTFEMMVSSGELGKGTESEGVPKGLQLHQMYFISEPVSFAYQKLKQGHMWWLTPVILALWESEAGESLEPGGRRMQ